MREIVEIRGFLKKKQLVDVEYSRISEQDVLFCRNITKSNRNTRRREAEECRAAS